MKHEDSGRRMKEEWIMEILRVSAVLLHVMFMKLYFSRAIFLYEVVMIRQQGSISLIYVAYINTALPRPNLKLSNT